MGVALHQPETVEDAVRLAGEEADARFLAGGQTLVAMMNTELIEPAALISLDRIASLRGIRNNSDGSVHIGAMTRHAQIAESEDLTGVHAVVRDAAQSDRPSSDPQSGDHRRRGQPRRPECRFSQPRWSPPTRLSTSQAAAVNARVRCLRLLSGLPDHRSQRRRARDRRDPAQKFQMARRGHLREIRPRRRRLRHGQRCGRTGLDGGRHGQLDTHRAWGLRAGACARCRGRGCAGGRRS